VLLSVSQLHIPVKNTAPEIDVNSDLALSQDKQAITVNGKSFLAKFSRENGGLTSLQVEGEELINKPLSPYFWRAPTDNDRDGWGIYSK